MNGMLRVLVLLDKSRTTFDSLYTSREGNRDELYDHLKYLSLVGRKIKGLSKEDAIQVVNELMAKKDALLERMDEWEECGNWFQRLISEIRYTTIARQSEVLLDLSIDLGSENNSSKSPCDIFAELVKEKENELGECLSLGFNE